MENFTTPRELLDHTQQAIKEAKQTIELVFMNPCRVRPDSERIDHEFMLQGIHDLAKDEKKIIKESNHLSIDINIFKLALSQIL